MEIMGKWKGLLYSFKVCKRLYECYWNNIKEVKEEECHSNYQPPDCEGNKWDG